MTITVIVVCSFITPRAASAATTAITIAGVVYDKDNHFVASQTVVAWCGGLSFFGGSGVTDTHGYYVIHTNSDDCPLGSELTVTTDIDSDGRSDGAAHTQTHSSTVVSIHLGRYDSVSIPEYDWLGVVAAGAAGVGIIGFIRRERV